MSSLPSICDFCSSPLSFWIYSIDGEMPFDKYICSRCRWQPVFVFREEIHLATEFGFPLEHDSKGQIVREIMIRQSFASDIPKGYFLMNPGTGLTKRHITTWALEILEYEYPDDQFNPLVLYRSNEVTHLTPSNAYQKMKTILTFM